MRKVIVCNMMSLDGYYAGPAGDVMVLPLDETFDAYSLERIRSAGTVLLGRRSYESFSSYWPGIADHPAPPGSNAAHSDRRPLVRDDDGRLRPPLHPGAPRGVTRAQRRPDQIRTWAVMPGCRNTVVSCMVNWVPVPASTARRYIASASATST